MTPSPNKMSEELQKEVLTQICLIKYGNTPSNLSSEQLAQVAFASSDMYRLIKQHREAYALESRIDEVNKLYNEHLRRWDDDECDIYKNRIAELREKVERDEN